MAPGNAPPPRINTSCYGNDVRRYGFELPARAASVGRARELTRHRLADWGIDEEACDSVVLVVSELVTNAILHAAGDHVVCEICAEGGQLRIAVEDEGYGPTGPRMYRASQDEGGRGLFLVDFLCSCWGVHATPGYGPGRVVWAELPDGTERPC